MLSLRTNHSAFVAAVAFFAASAAGVSAQTILLRLAPQSMKPIATVDERFQSYNVEMIEVTGGRFWAPYKQSVKAPADTTQPTPGDMPASLYRYRSPIDLSNTKLRKLAAALGPAYIRVSGTWANTTFFQDSDDPAPAKPPSGFNGVLTRAQWRSVIDFANAVDAKLVTSFAVSQGVRDTDGVWTPIEAQKLVNFTRSDGGSIAAAELFNEPTFATIGGAPKGYDAAAYARDFRAFRAFIEKADPQMKVLGPGGVGEAGSLGPLSGMHLLKSEDILNAEGPGLDAFSYHFYGGVSQRCAPAGAPGGTTSQAALSDDWLTRTDRDEAFYAALRDRFTPGKPLWLTETGETACGGDPWASSFIDTFRYLNQLGSLASRGVQVVMHNTLDASDYALIDESTLTPRPNYWAAVLWRRLMGTTVLDAGTPHDSLYLYAHCLRNKAGGVALLAINAHKANTQVLDLPEKSTRYSLTSSDLLSTTVALNGIELALSSNGDLPALEGAPQAAGHVSLAPASITFFALPGAHNTACR
jgi:hypothetical protein